jgi:hypothetical protein
VGTVYAVAGAESVEPDEPYVVLRLWLGTWQGDLIGVLTDPPSPQGLAQTTCQLVRLAHVGGVQKTLIDDRLEPITGLAPTEMDPDEVLRDIWPREFGRSAVTVDGSAVPVDTLTYRGLEFAFGAEVTRFPFTVIRPAGARGPWPDLVAREADWE